MTERIRDLVTGELTLDYFMRRSAEGWHVASVEWVRESTAVASAASPDKTVETDVPYGLRVSENGFNLEENPLESTVLLLILEQIVQEKRIGEIAFQLNQRGYLTRDGSPWSPTAVFNLMPRLIEAGPALLKSTAWQSRRHAN